MIRLLLSLLVILCYSHSYSQNFITRWDTTQPGSANTAITIPTNPTYTYNYTVDWGDGTTNNNVTGDLTHNYATPGIYTVAISGDFPSIYFNDAGDKEKLLEILQWGNLQWQSMEDAFHGCINLNFDAIDAPDLTQVTSLKNMFRDCLVFNGILNNWDTSNITDLAGIFANCKVFNRPLDNWNTIGVTDMSEAFKNCNRFNEPLDNWNTASATTMKDMLYACVTFNQNINNWDVSQVTDMSGMFVACRRYNQPMNNWDVSKVTDMNLMLFRTNDFNQDLSGWQVGQVTNMARMFDECAINYPLNNWDVSQVTNMSGMFKNTPNFNQPLDNWNVSLVTNMSGMFQEARAFNQPIENWDVGQVTNMAYMFNSGSNNGNVVFNQPLNSWNVANVTDMSGMFTNNQYFNQPLNNWTLTSLVRITSIFENTDSFNQNIENWDVSNVALFANAFKNNDAFNQPLNNWDMGSATNLSGMFANTPLFNQPLNNWNLSQVTDFSSVFRAAQAFNQDISSWDVSAATTLNNMLDSSGLSQENYDALLISWAAQSIKDDLNLGAASLTYCDGLNARQSLIDNHNWSFTGDSVNCSYVLCTQITSPLNTDTQVPANSDIRWAPAPNATGYTITLEIERGGNRTYANFNGNVANNLDVGNVVGLSFTNEFMPGDTVFVTVVPYNADGPASGCAETSFTVIESWANSPEAFKITIDTRNVNTNSSNPNQYRLDLNDGWPGYLTYNFAVDWGDGQYNNNVAADITHTYLTPGVYTIAIIGDFPSFYQASSNRDNLKLISMDQWGSQVWQSMHQTFYFCENMVYNATDVPNLSQVSSMDRMFRRTYLFDADINNWDVSNVSSMNNTFYQASIFNSPLDNWDVGNVTSMDNMFNSATAFNQNIDNWDVGSVTSMQYLFSSTENFNQPLNSWDVSAVTNMRSIFHRAQAFNQALDNWNTSNVTNMEAMFNYAVAFNQNINNWDVSAVTNMKGMFENTRIFNQPLNTWDVGQVTTMESMFSNTPVFDQPLNNWDTNSVTTMNYMFSGAQAFNQNIESWNVTNVTSMTYMFSHALNFDQPLNNWDVNSVVSMWGMFRRAGNFNQPLANWNVSAVANMSNMFEAAEKFDQPLGNWDVSSVTLMKEMFLDADAFNQDINNWDVGVVTNFNAMFKNAVLFNSPLDSWDTAEALNMAEMFYGATAFDQPIAPWNVAYVNNMQGMFREASNFNQQLDSWNVASVNTMQDMFREATAFNGTVAGWNVRGVTTMENMFYGATAFNQAVNDWRITNVTNMNAMFQNATAFNQPMHQWNLGATSLTNMFNGASAFDQYLGNWNLENITNLQGMLDNAALSRENYDNTLIAWSDQNLPNGLSLGATNQPYCDAAQERQSILTTKGWSINGDIRDCPIPNCTQLTAPLDGDTAVPINTNLNWSAALYAENYELAINIQPGNTNINQTVSTNFYEFAPGVLNMGDSVSVTITPTNNEGTAVGCTTESFTIANNPAMVPNCTQLITPINGDSAVAITTNLAWEAIPNADGYRLSLGTSPAGTDLLNNQDVGNLTNYELATDLPEDTQIFVGITPYNEIGDATGCTTESFTTEIIPVAPSCTTLVSPQNGSTNLPLDTALSWNAVSGAEGYLVVVGITQGGIEVANNIDVGNTTNYSFTEDLRENRTHYVTIIPYNAVGDAMGCTEERFRTGQFTQTDPPDCTNLSTPVDGAVAIDSATSLSWSAVPNADGYRLSIGTAANTADIIANVDLGNVTNYTPANNFAAGAQIFVTITPYNANGNAMGCTTESFTVASPLPVPNCTSLTYPINTDTNIAVDTDLEWGTVTDAQGYLLSMGTQSGGKDILDQLDVGNQTTYDLPTDLPAGATIFVHITPYNSSGQAQACAEESFTTIATNIIPSCSMLMGPHDGEINVPTDTDLFWNPIVNAAGYYLTVTASQSTVNNLNNINVTTGAAYLLPGEFIDGETVSVLIVPYNAAGPAQGCANQTFTIGTPTAAPACTSLTGPTNSQNNVALNTSINWNASTNATGYRLNIGSSAGGTDIVNNLDVGNTTTHNLATDLPADTQIFVSIIPYNATGSATGCTAESFTTIGTNNSLACALLTAPRHMDIDVPTTADLSWSAVPNAAGYRLSVGTTANGLDILDQVDVGNTTTHDLMDELPEDTEIFVTITPYNNNTAAMGCASESFITTSTPATLSCPTLSQPSEGETDVAINTAISWQAIEGVIGYRISIGTTAGGSDIVDHVDVGSRTQYQPSQDLPEGQEIFVSIAPYNVLMQPANCSPQSFTTVGSKTISVQQGFSPDGDGINDFWTIEGIENHPNNRVVIFNRWGDKVFEIEAYDNAGHVFKGEANQMTQLGAKQLPAGTYFFQIFIPEQTNLETKGFLVLKR